jgi:hypothetical protein
MVAQRRLVPPVAALLLLAACAREPVGTAEPVVLARSMLEVLAPRTNEIVGVLIDNLDAQGEIDPAKLSEESWAAIEAALASVRAETIALRDRPIRVVAAPGDTIFGEDTGGLSAADVQALIEADRVGFNAYLDAMLADFQRMDGALAARDGATLWELAGALDVTCNACHSRFWYPEWDEETPRPP